MAKTALDLALEREHLLRCALVADYHADRYRNRQFVRGVIGKSDAQVTKCGQLIAKQTRLARRFRERAEEVEKKLTER